jgi:hypothetical protein
MKSTRQLKLPSSYALSLSFKGDRVAAIGRNVVIGDTLSMRRLASSHPLPHPSHACFNSAGTSLAVKSTSGRIVVLNPTTGATDIDFANSTDGEGSNIAFSADGGSLVDATWNGALKVSDVKNGQVRQEFAYPGEMITELSCSTDGGSVRISVCKAVSDLAISLSYGPCQAAGGPPRLCNALTVCPLLIWRHFALVV